MFTLCFIFQLIFITNEINLIYILMIININFCAKQHHLQLSLSNNELYL